MHFFQFKVFVFNISIQFFSLNLWNTANLSTEWTDFLGTGRIPAKLSKQALYIAGAFIADTRYSGHKEPRDHLHWALPLYSRHSNSWVNQGRIIKEVRGFKKFYWINRFYKLFYEFSHFNIGAFVKYFLTHSISQLSPWKK